MFFGAAATVSLFIFDESISATQQGKIVALEQETKTARNDAASASRKTADLLVENMELERAVAPRHVDHQALSRELENVPRKHLFVSSMSTEEPKSFADSLSNGLAYFKFGNASLWQVSVLPPKPWYVPGISIEYTEDIKSEFGRFASNKDVAEVAWLLCNALSAQGLVVNSRPILVGTGERTKRRDYYLGWRKTQQLLVQ